VITFDVWSNHLTGTVPATVTNWKVVKAFSVDHNQIAGGALPPMPFTKMWNCNLLDHPSGSNAFNCPWPQGATEKCTKFDDVGKYVNVTDSDCIPLPTPPPAPPAPGNTCTGMSTQLPKNQCDAWQSFWDGAGGDAGWTSAGASCTKTDPCKLGCGGYSGKFRACNGAGTTVTNMSVPAPPHSLPRTPRHPPHPPLPRAVRPPRLLRARRRRHTPAAADLPASSQPCSLRSAGWAAPT
jgi:hypothetical protein